MVTLSDFFRIECDLYVRNLLLETIELALNDNCELRELIFNVYSVEIFPKKGEVILYNDIDVNEKPLCLSLNDFYSEVKGFSR